MDVEENVDESSDSECFEGDYVKIGFDEKVNIFHKDENIE